MYTAPVTEAGSTSSRKPRITSVCSADTMVKLINMRLRECLWTTRTVRWPRASPPGMGREQQSGKRLAAPQCQIKPRVASTKLQAKHAPTARTCVAIITTQAATDVGASPAVATKVIVYTLCKGGEAGKLAFLSHTHVVCHDDDATLAAQVWWRNASESCQKQTL